MAFKVPPGCVLQAYRFAVDPTPRQLREFRSNAGAARFAYNHMLALVKAVMNQREAERSYGLAAAELTPPLDWSLPALRRVWNERKSTVAPWWRENSKEAYNTGLDALARALDAWKKSRSGDRLGQRVGFPRFKAARDRRRVRFSTGIIRVEADRKHVTLPRIGRVKTHESTRKLARRVENGTARLLSATLTEDVRGRWYVAFQVQVERSVDVRRLTRAVGVDVGLKALVVVGDADGNEIDRVLPARSLHRSLVRMAKLERTAQRRRGPYDELSRQFQEPSNRWRKTQKRLAKLHAHNANSRRDLLHKTTTKIARENGVIVVETLNVRGMSAGGGRRKRAFNRALADAALAELRRMLTYKAEWYGSNLVLADRWYPSSKTCSGCGAVKAKLTLDERVFECCHCGTRIDRDLNAAVNLARLAGSGSATGRGAICDSDPALRVTSEATKRQPCVA